VATVAARPGKLGEVLGVQVVEGIAARRSLQMDGLGVLHRLVNVELLELRSWCRGGGDSEEAGGGEGGGERRSRVARGCAAA
jgi:hypothetical protein